MKNLSIGWTCLLLFAAPIILGAQPTFQKAMIGTGWDVQPTAGGGRILCGLASLSGATGNDLFLMKTNAIGDTLWSRAVGGGDFDTGIAAVQTADGGFIAVGYTYSQSAGASDGYAVKTDAAGNPQWVKSYGGLYAEDLVAVRQTPDGGFAMLGSSASFGSGNTDFDVYLVRTDGDGDTVWTRRYGTPGADNGLDLLITADNGFLITGYGNGFGAGQDDAFLMKVDAGGDLEWTKAYGGTQGDVGSAVTATTDGGYLIAGKTHSFGAFGNDGDLYLVKTDAQGDLQWSQTYGGAGTEWGHAVQQVADGGYLVTGWTYSFGAGFSDAYLIKTDDAGDLQWSKAYGGAGLDFGFGLLATSTQGNTIVGQTSSFGNQSFYLYLTDETGESGCFAVVTATIQSAGATQVHSPSVGQYGTATVVTVPDAYLTSGTVVDVFCTTVGSPAPADLDITLFPNPASEVAILAIAHRPGQSHALQVFDSQGRLMYTEEKIPGNSTEIPCGDWPRGLYACRISGKSGKSAVVRLVVE